jgi:hypothetical protein
MPLETTHKVFYGSEARRIRSAARNAFVSWLDGKLNDPEGDYYEALGLGTPLEDGEDGEVLEVIVTGSAKHAARLFDGADGTPVVYVRLGPSEEWMPYGQTIDGVTRKGKRHEITLDVDMGINEVDSDNENALTEAENDSELADFVLDAISKGGSELADVGLHNVEVKPDTENQRAGVGRNPHIVKFFAISLDNYNP